MNFFPDEIPSNDCISLCYQEKEIWAKNQIDVFNQQLASLGKPKITLGLIDVLSHDILYSKIPQVLLVDYKLRDKKQFCNPVFEIPSSIYGIYYMPKIEWHRKIDKSFNCFINRNEPIRQSWFYLLYVRELFNDGYISFSGQSRIHKDCNGLELFDQIHQDTLSSFDSVYHDIRSLVPYKNFQETGNLCDTMLATKFSIVIETYFERPATVTFSEKIFRALQVPRPWLLFHATGSVDILRNLGFYVYDDIVDHSYDKFDTTNDSVQRQESILQQAKQLMNLDITDSMIDHWEKKTHHNRKILQEWNNCWKEDFVKISTEAYNTALLL
jgi:hypothetical protein